MAVATKKKINVTEANAIIMKPRSAKTTASTKSLNMFADLDEHIVKNGGRFSVANLNLLRA
jgi:hypothetical protein